jgi:hypothetical protein
MNDAASPILGSYRVEATPLFVVGTFDTGVTVLSQQIRALNLVCGLVESELVPCVGDESPAKKLAIVGGGFSGLTIAAGLIKKGANAEIAIFEERDTLLHCNREATHGGFIRISMTGPKMGANPTPRCFQS